MTIFTVRMGGREYQVSYEDNLACAVKRELSKQNQKPRWCAVDFESDGLHIKKSRPSVGAFGWKGRVFVFPATEQNCEAIPELANEIGMIFNHNINFDLHMAANVLNDDRYARRFKLYGDTMGLCRLIFEALSPRHGGDSLALKRIGKKYIDPNADKYEKQLKAWISKKKTMNRRILSSMLKDHKWNITKLEKAMNDGKYPIPDEVMKTFQSWRNLHPEPNYTDVPEDILFPYVATDVILVDILVEMALPVVQYRQQTGVMMREFKCLPIVWETERQGIEVDRSYLIEANEKLEDMITDLKMRMYDLAGREFSVGQHNVIKDIYEERLGERPVSTDKAFLKKQESEGDELASIIMKLRRLEKWKETYVERILDISEYDGRFYTSLNQFNPISGRFSSDAQQFPRDAIYDDNGNEVFNPRRAFKMRGYYLDFSQVELRVQAHYTLYFGGDVNLCRAYMPFKCVHYQSGEIYDFQTDEGRARWKEMREGAPTDIHWEKALKDGWSAWIVPETGKPWIPTDVHSATTVRALRIMGMNPEEMDEKTFAWWRSKGKSFNFMRNYGGGDAMAAEVLDITFEQAQAMNRGYTDAFPLVVSYQKGIEETLHKQGYVTNMYGRRYYISNPRNFYRAANYCIQGTCADDLKEKLIKIDEFIQKNNLKIRMVLYVHDEIQFSVPDPSEDWAIWEIKKIMEYTPNILVPIIAEVEFTDTYWSEKKTVLG